MGHDAGEWSWATPGAATDDEGLAGQDRTAGPRPAPGVAAAIPRLPLRPLTVAGVLDGAVAIIKARPRRILGITTAFVVPAYAVAAYLQRDAGSVNLDGLLGNDPTVAGEVSGSPRSAQFAAAGLQFTASAVAILCVTVAVTFLVSQWSQGQDASSSDMVAAVGRGWGPLLASFVVWSPVLGSLLLLGVAPALGFLAIVVSLFAVARFVVVAPVVGAEGAATGVALRRSLRLTRGRYWRTLGLMLLVGFVGSTLGNLLTGMLQIPAVIVGLDRGWPLLAAAGVVGQLLTVPFVAAATVLLYLDLRVRAEGLDLEMTARRVLDRAA